MDRRGFFQTSIVAAVAAMALFVNLGKPRLWDRDEPRNARCAAEMFARADWIVPTFNGELRAHKPVLLYWLMLSSYAAFGETEFAARLPSAVLGVATALVTMAMGRRLFSARAGLWAGVILATSLSFDIAGRAATPDGALLFCVTAALAIFVWAAIPARVLAAQGGATASSPAMPGLLGWCGVYAMLGLAGLAKGPVGILLVVAILGAFLLVATGDGGLIARLHPRRAVATALQMRPVALTLVVLAIAAPWYVAVHVQTGGAFSDEFFFRHNFERATSAMEGHRGPIVYYLGAGLVGFFPWSILAVPLALESRRMLREGGRDGLAVKFALCWAGVWIAAFSLVSTKLPSYITPAYPALALLAGSYVDRWLDGRAVSAARWMPWALAALAAVGAGLAVALPLVARRYLPGDEVLGALGLIPLVAAAMAWLWLRRQRTNAAAWTLAVGATAFVVALFGFAQVRVDRRQVSEEIAAFVQRDSPGPPTFVAFRDLEPSMVYYARQTVPTVFDPADAAELFERNEQAYLLASSAAVDELRPRLPADVEIVARRPRFLESGEVVVFARTGTSIARRRSAAAAHTAESPAKERR